MIGLIWKKCPVSNVLNIETKFQTMYVCSELTSAVALEMTVFLVLFRLLLLQYCSDCYCFVFFTLIHQVGKKRGDFATLANFEYHYFAK